MKKIIILLTLLIIVLNCTEEDKLISRIAKEQRKNEKCYRRPNGRFYCIDEKGKIYQ